MTQATIAQKCATMHHWAGIVTDHRNSPAKKLETLDTMSVHFDKDTRSHFLSALTQVLRDEKVTVVRKEAISLLACYFTWIEIEWTFWLHAKRRPEDAKTLAVYKLYTKNKRAHGFRPSTLIGAVIVYKEGLTV